MPFHLSPSSPGLPISPYHSYDEFIRRWGLKNVQVAANKQSATVDPDMAAIQDGFTFAVQEIANAQNGGAYAVPLDFSDFGGVIPAAVKNWAMVIAYNFLYEERGIKSTDKEGNKLSKLVDQVYREMQYVRAGFVVINAAKNSQDLTPSIVRPRDVLTDPLEPTLGRNIDGVPHWRF